MTVFGVVESDDANTIDIRRRDETSDGQSEEGLMRWF